MRPLYRLDPDGKMYSAKRNSSFITARLYWPVEVFMERIFNCRFSVDYFLLKILNLHLLSEYPCKVIVKNKGHQDQENEETYFLGHFPFSNADGLPKDKLYDEKKDHAAI